MSVQTGVVLICLIVSVYLVICQFNQTVGFRRWE